MKKAFSEECIVGAGVIQVENSEEVLFRDPEELIGFYNIFFESFCKSIKSITYSYYTYSADAFIYTIPVNDKGTHLTDYLKLQNDLLTTHKIAKKENTAIDSQLFTGASLGNVLIMNDSLAGDSKSKAIQMADLAKEENTFLVCEKEILSNVLELEKFRKQTFRPMAIVNKNNLDVLMLSEQEVVGLLEWV